MPRPPSTSPPPAAFSFMSGNFDYPHASTSPPPATSRNTGSHESFQQFLARREQERVNGSAAGEDIPLPPRRPPRVQPSGRRALRRTLASQQEPREFDRLMRRPLSSSNEAGRPRATPSERYLRRSHARLREPRSTDMDSTTDILDALSDAPPNPFTAAANAGTRPRSPISELEGTRRQTKRRKIEHDSNLRSPYDGFKYGHKGQVVQGRLKMEIVSCDGGEYDKHSAYGLYPIQNVLKNDKSVYCSERSRCNLLLKHIAEMPFTLEKVVIRAPDRGFTAPVQEGLVFVSMSSSDLLSGTSNYKIEYGSPPPSPTPSDSLGGEQLSLREAINDPYIWQNSREGMQEPMEDQIERLRLRSRRVELENSIRSDVSRRREERREERRNIGLAQAAHAEQMNNFSVENCEEPEDEPYTTVAGVSAPTPPPFTVTTESEEESESNEELPSAAIMADRLRRASRWREDTDEEEDDLYRFPPSRRSYALDLWDANTDRHLRNERYMDPIRAQRRGAPSRIEVKDGQSETESTIMPHAKFFIAKHKNKITIKFHPAVSGKFVLLKLWSPTHDGNIDIESVQFFGYSGPRFFPSIEPR